MRIWRKIHIFSFGYFKVFALVISALMVVISVTGVLYNHHHDLVFLREARVPTALLPGKYQVRLDRTRQAQGLGDLFPEEAETVPVMWVITDLHTGEFFFGTWGRLFYDVIGVMFIVLAATGVYLYFQIRRKSRL